MKGERERTRTGKGQEHEEGVGGRGVIAAVNAAFDLVKSGAQVCGFRKQIDAQENERKETERREKAT